MPEQSAFRRERRGKRGEKGKNKEKKSRQREREREREREVHTGELFNLPITENPGPSRRVLNGLPTTAIYRRFYFPWRTLSSIPLRSSLSFGKKAIRRVRAKRTAGFHECVAFSLVLSLPFVYGRTKLGITAARGAGTILRQRVDDAPENEIGGRKEE